jgi:hypothetical protein
MYIYIMLSNFLVDVYGTLTDVLSLINSKTVNTVEITTQNPTNQKYNITFNQTVAIRTADITIGLNGYCLNGEQKYTFGPAQQPLFVGGGQGVPSRKSLRRLLEPPGTDLSSRARLIGVITGIRGGSHCVASCTVGETLEQLVGPVHAERSAFYLGSAARPGCDRTWSFLPF